MFRTISRTSRSNAADRDGRAPGEPSAAAAPWAGTAGSAFILALRSPGVACRCGSSGVSRGTSRRHPVFPAPVDADAPPRPRTVSRWPPCSKLPGARGSGLPGARPAHAPWMGWKGKATGRRGGGCRQTFVSAPLNSNEAAENCAICYCSFRSKEPGEDGGGRWPPSESRRQVSGAGFERFGTELAEKGWPI